MMREPLNSVSVSAALGQFDRGAAGADDGAGIGDVAILGRVGSPDADGARNGAHVDDIGDAGGDAERPARDSTGAHISHLRVHLAMYRSVTRLRRSNRVVHDDVLTLMASGRRDDADIGDRGIGRRGFQFDPPRQIPVTRLITSAVASLRVPMPVVAVAEIVPACPPGRHRSLMPCVATQDRRYRRIRYIGGGCRLDAGMRLKSSRSW